MSEPFKLGVIGGGINSAVGTTHIIASQLDGRFHVSAGCFSRHADINAQTADRWQIPQQHRYNEFSQLLEQEQKSLDAILVLTPTPNHVHPVTEALKRGYPVICEKALASSSNDVRIIQKTQNDTGGFLAVTYNYTGYAMLRELKKIIQTQHLGKIKQIQIEMPQEGYARVNQQGEYLIPQEWRLHDVQLPTISLDLGVHVHHIIDFLTGEKPKDLVAMQSSQAHFPQVIDNITCLARYSNNLECTIWFSKSALGYRNGLKVRVFGEKGAAEWQQTDPEYLTLHSERGHKTIIDRGTADVAIAHELRYNRFKAGHPTGFIEAFANLYWDIANCLQQFKETGHQDNHYVYSSQHALEGLIMLETMHQSANNRSWETVQL